MGLTRQSEACRTEGKPAVDRSRSRQWQCSRWNWLIIILTPTMTPPLIISRHRDSLVTFCCKTSPSLLRVCRRFRQAGQVTRLSVRNHDRCANHLHSNCFEHQWRRSDGPGSPFVISVHRSDCSLDLLVSYHCRLQSSSVRLMLAFVVQHRLVKTFIHWVCCHPCFLLYMPTISSVFALTLRCLSVGCSYFFAPSEWPLFPRLLCRLVGNLITHLIGQSELMVIVPIRLFTTGDHKVTKPSFFFLYSWGCTECSRITGWSAEAQHSCLGSPISPEGRVFVLPPNFCIFAVLTFIRNFVKVSFHVWLSTSNVSSLSCRVFIPLRSESNPTKLGFCLAFVLARNFVKVSFHLCTWPLTFCCHLAGSSSLSAWSPTQQGWDLVLPSSWPEILWR